MRKTISGAGFIAAVVITIGIAGWPQHGEAQDAGVNAGNDERLARFFERFPAADANGDGNLTLAEARAFAAKRKENRGKEAKGASAPKPFRSDVRYGEHERNVYDLWLPEGGDDAESPLPLLVYFHGGGFVGGDKSTFDPRSYLREGFAVVSVNYRLVDGKTTVSPVPFHDSARVIQHLRHHAQDWNLDPARVVVSGGSAGAVISMWIGYHDDLADPEAEDPVARESTRVSSIAPINGPTQLDPVWILENLGGPPEVHSSFPKLFGAGVNDLEANPEVQALVREASPMEHVTPDDVPTLLLYKGGLGGIPLPPTASQGKVIHHAWFGKALKEKLDEAGVPNEFHPDLGKPLAPTVAEWARKHWDG